MNNPRIARVSRRVPLSPRAQSRACPERSAAKPNGGLAVNPFPLLFPILHSTFCVASCIPHPPLPQSTRWDHGQFHDALDLAGCGRDRNCDKGIGI